MHQRTHTCTHVFIYTQFYRCPPSTRLVCRLSLISLLTGNILYDYDVYCTQIITYKTFKVNAISPTLTPEICILHTYICDLDSKKRSSPSCLNLLDVLDTALYKQAMNNLVLIYLFGSLMPDWSN